MSRHRFHGDPERFTVLADFVADHYWRNITYIADVAGGQGMLTRLLTKKYNYDCEVIDPRVHVLKGVKSQACEFSAAHAAYYDLVIGLHPDEATRAVAQAALVRPVILIPCCNFWSAEKLGQAELLLAIEAYYQENGILFERVKFAFKGPKNVGLVSTPPTGDKLAAPIA
ncbi:MAG: hypothetical protein KF832_20650 [Caldilineaceae bacterium]|nr:hypothetical protein [Caldilineaceae bacterium]